MSEIDWKKLLLKSGLPFEYEVKECFVKQGCTVWDEYSYVKEDENNVEKEFSHDQQANTWIGGNSVDFLIECKYKTEPTKWFFSPDPYAYQDELTRNDFLHPVDHFIDNKFPFTESPYDKVQDALGPFCLKGVELLGNKCNDLTIYKAINQLSYAFVHHYMNSIENQMSDGQFGGGRYFQIPVIITNAELYLINEGVTTKDIAQSKSIEEISHRENFLIFHNKIGQQLRAHNYDKVYAFFNNLPMTDRFKAKNKSFTEDISQFINIVASVLCPQAILVMHHDEAHQNYKKLFDYITFFMVQSPELKKRVKEEMEKLQETLKQMESKPRKNKKEGKSSTKTPKKQS